MEPDVHVLARAQARIQGANAGDHTMGPGTGSRGGERVPWRGELGLRVCRIGYCLKIECGGKV